MVQNTEKVMGILLFLNSDFFNCRSEEKHQQFTLYFNCEILKQSLKQISMILSLHIKIPSVCMYTPPPPPPVQTCHLRVFSSSQICKIFTPN